MNKLRITLYTNDKKRISFTLLDNQPTRDRVSGIFLAMEALALEKENNVQSRRELARQVGVKYTTLIELLNRFERHIES